MDAEAKIIFKHNLDCSTLENLAKDISSRIGYNIEYGQYQKEEEKNHFIILGTVVDKENGIIGTLYDLRNNKNSTYNFVLEIGEVAKLIYEDYIDFIPPWEEDYDIIANEYHTKGFPTDSFYYGILNEFAKLGGDKVYFIKNTFAPELAFPENKTIETYLKTVQNESTYFEVPLTNN